MELSNSLKGGNSVLAEKILEDFNKSLAKISYSNLWYRISNFFGKDLELLTYKNSKNNFIFYKDKTWVETHISVYNAIEGVEKERWVVIELIIWESKKKDIIFFSENKIYNIVENKWGKIIESNIIENHNNIYNILSFVNEDINYMSNKVVRYQSKLRERGILNREIQESQVEKFKVNFKNLVLQS